MTQFQHRFEAFEDSQRNDITISRKSQEAAEFKGLNVSLGKQTHMFSLTFDLDL